MAESKVVVPESVLKKIKREEKWALAKKQKAAGAKKKAVETRKLIFKRAEQYAKEYTEKALRLQHVRSTYGAFFVFAVTNNSTMSGIHGTHDSCPLVKNILLLDSEGKRVAVKYYSDDWSTHAAKLTFEKYVFSKTSKTKR